MRFRNTFLSLLLIGFGLSACDTIDSMKIWRDAKPEPCPRITVLKNASELTRFKQGLGRDLIDVLFSAKVSNVLSKCDYDVDYDTRVGTIDIQLQPVIAAKRGPADTTRSAQFEYFVAVVDQNKKILQKSTFPIKFAFPGNLSQNTVRDDPIDLTIVTDGSKDGSNYEIYMGIQLTAEEIQYNNKLFAR